MVRRESGVEIKRPQDAETREAPTPGRVEASENDLRTASLSALRRWVRRLRVSTGNPWFSDRPRFARRGPDEGQDVFAEQVQRAIAATPRAGLDALSKEVWAAYGTGALTDAEAGEACEMIAARRAVTSAPSAPRRVGSRPRSSASMERRRAWTASGWLPPAVAARFTMGEAAALAVIVAEAAKAGRCGLPIGAIAGRAGVCATTVRNALREARRFGLVRVEERRLSYARSLPNLVTIAGRELALWVRTRARVERQGGGCKTVVPTTNHSFPRTISVAETARVKGSRGRERWVS